VMGEEAGADESPPSPIPHTPAQASSVSLWVLSLVFPPELSPGVQG
jgi:hypothetical protein